MSAESGWWPSQSQANWIIVERNLGFPAFDTPCSRLTAPLCHGVGASPA